MTECLIAQLDIPSQACGPLVDMMITMVQDFDPCMADEIRARRGQTLRFLERQGLWLLVADVDGRTGYIPAAYCRPFVQSDEPCALQRMTRDSARYSARRSLRLSLGQRCTLSADDRDGNKERETPTGRELDATGKTLTVNRKSASLKPGAASDNQVLCSLARLLRLSKLRTAFKAAHAAHTLRRSTLDAGTSRAEKSQTSEHREDALFAQAKTNGTRKDFSADSAKIDGFCRKVEENLAKGLYSPVHLQAKRRAGLVRRVKSQYGSPHRNSPSLSRRRLGAFSSMMQNRRRSTDDSVLNLDDKSRDVFGQPTSGEYAKAQAYSPREAHMLFEKNIARIETSPVKQSSRMTSPPPPPPPHSGFPNKRMSLPFNFSYSDAQSTHLRACAPATKSPIRSPKMQRSLTFNAARMSPKAASLACCSDSDVSCSSSSAGSSWSTSSSFLRQDGNDILEELTEEYESPVFEEPPIGSPSRQISRRFLVLFDYTANAKDEACVDTGDIVIQARPRMAGRRHSAHAQMNNNPRGSDWTYVMKTSGGSGYVPTELLQVYRTGVKDGVSATAL